MSDTKAPAVMSVKDRTELRRILKARFEILRSRLQTRETEVRNALKEQLEKEHKDAIKEAERRTRALEAKRAKLLKEVDEFKGKMRVKAETLRAEGDTLAEEMKDKGVVLKTRRHYGETNARVVKVSMDNWASEDYFIEIQNEWTPSELAEKVNKAYQQIAEEAGLHKLDLDLRELELSEELAIGALASDEAKGFLGKIPNIDNLLPAPNGNVRKALEAAK